MKKNLILVVYAIFVSFICWNNFDYKITSDINKDATELIITNNTNPDVGSDLEKASNEYNTPLFVSMVDNNVYDFYVSNNFNLKKYGYNQKLSGDEFISNNKTNDSKQVGYIPYSNNVRTVNIHSLMSLQRTDNYSVLMYDNAKNADLIVKNLSEKYTVNYNSNQKMTTVNLIRSNFLFIILLIFLLIISVFNFFNENMNELFIKKLNGYSVFKLITEDILKYILVYVYSFSCIFLVLDLIKFYNVEELFFSLIYAFKYLLIFLIPLIILIAIIGFFAFKQPMNLIIKGKKSKGISVLGLTIKLITNVIIIVSILTIIPAIKKVHNLEQTAISYQTIADYNTVRKIGEKEISEKQYADLYSYINKNNDAILIDSSDAINSETTEIKFITANENYINETGVYNEKLDTQKDNMINIIVPNSLSNKSENELIDALKETRTSVFIPEKINYNFIVVDDFKIPAYNSMYSENGGYLNNTPIIVVDQDLDNHFYQSSIAGSENVIAKISQNELASYLSSNGLSIDSFLVQNKNITLEQNIELYQNILVKLLIISVTALTSLFLINKAIVEIYLKNKHQEIYAKYVLGYKLLDIYNNFIVINISITLVSALLALLVFMMMNSITPLIVITLLLVIVIDLVNLKVVVLKNTKLIKE